MTTPEPLVPDGWELSGNRQSTLHLAGQRWQLKAPTLGELREISEAIETVTDSGSLLAHETQASLAELQKRVEAEEASPHDLMTEGKRLSRELNQYLERAWFDVLSLIFERLCDRPVPDSTTCPAWIYTSASQQIADLITFWRQAPPRRGGVPQK